MKKFLAILPLALVFAVGCKKGHDLNGGSWQGTAGSIPVTLQFEGTNVTQKMEIPGMPGGKKINLSVTGNYTLADTKLTITPNKVDIDADPAIKALAEGQAKDKMNKPVDFTVEWVSDDEIKLTGSMAPGAGSQALMLKRSK